MANTPRQEITIDIIKEIYPIAMDVYNKNKTLDRGVNYLIEEIEMKKRTATVYIEFFINLKKGKLYRNIMGINCMALTYFLKQIFNTDGKDGLKTALESLDAYIEYTDNLPKSRNLIEFREIHDEFLAKLK